MKGFKCFLMMFLPMLSTSTSTLAAIDVLTFENAQQEESYHKLSAELRCPQCQNNNIADSNSLIAQDMRKKVFTLLKEGKDEKQIVAYMVERYGDFVTYDPPLKLSTIFLWLAPLFVLAIALMRIFRPAPIIDKKTQTTFNDEEKARLEAILNKDKL